MGPFISLIQVPSIIKAIINNEEPKIGTNTAIAESFGSTLPGTFNKRYNELPNEVLIRVFTHRVRIYTRHGTATYNTDLDEFEEINGDELRKIVKDAINALQH
jgi:hypothetical protein